MSERSKHSSGEAEQPLPPPTVGGESVLDGDAASAGRNPVIIGSPQPGAIGAGESEHEILGAGLSGVGVTGVGASGRARLGDRVFLALASGSGVFVVLLVVSVGAFLVYQAVPAIRHDGVNFFTSREWNVTAGTPRFGVAGLLFTTVLISGIAMLFAVPVSIGIALFMTQYAPKALARPIAYVIDLLAAIPSIVYGIWGVTVLSPRLEPVQQALYHLGGFPIFKDVGFLRASVFDGAVVLAIMILPIITAVSRDVFERTPPHNIEAALALGATRWEMIRMTVLPYGRAGVVSGAMLGLGRALGETVAILLIVSAPANGTPFHLSIFNGGQTFASKIAGDSAEFPGAPGPYIAAGLVLFLLTFVVNAAARTIVNRRKEFTS